MTIKFYFGIMNSFNRAKKSVREDESTYTLSFNSQLFSCDIVEDTRSTALENLFKWKQEFFNKN